MTVAYTDRIGITALLPGQVHGGSGEEKQFQNHARDGVLGTLILLEARCKTANRYSQSVFRKTNDDLAHEVAVLEVVEGCGSVLKVEHPIDQRPDLVLVDEVIHFFEVRA